MSRTRRGCTASPPRPRFEDRLALWDVAAGPNQPLRCPVPWAGSAELGHLVTPEELRTLVTDAELEVIARNDLTGPFARLMHTVLNAPPRPLGLHVCVPDFDVKATNLIDNLDHERARLIQACCARSEGPPVNGRLPPRAARPCPPAGRRSRRGSKHHPRQGSKEGTVRWHTTGSG